MTNQEVTNAITAVGLPVSYREFPTGNAPEPPYIIYFYDGNDDMIADNENYVKIEELVIELYSLEKDFEHEQAIENMLKENKIPFTKQEEYIQGTLMYRITYESEVVIYGE